MHTPTAEELRAAIAAVTRALASADERDQVLELVRERRAMRRELDALETTAVEPPRRSSVA